MATINPGIERNPDQSILLYTYVDLNETDTVGAPIPFAEYADRSVQISGTFGGATIVWEGSNDGTNYITLTDPQGNAISKTAASIEGVLEITRYARPRITGGAGGTTDLNVTVLCRRQNGMRT
jgi:hypothetical protein